ncbi:MAG: DUF4864 domain-containing protein [Parvibaculales bacterium]|nr:DUF4864 domain-containing protein [Alphaproteobacteria bacterium]
MPRGRISIADIAVLALLAALAIGTALLQNRHQPLALHDQNIRAIIEAQIDAFRVQDDVTAFGFASPDLRAQFIAPNRFMDMVRAHYRPVYMAQRVAFTGTARAISQTPLIRLQDVYLVDDRGVSHKARYMMQKQPDGSWKIAGCQLLASNQMDI